MFTPLHVDMGEAFQFHGGEEGLVIGGGYALTPRFKLIEILFAVSACVSHKPAHHHVASTLPLLPARRFDSRFLKLHITSLSIHPECLGNAVFPDPT